MDKPAVLIVEDEELMRQILREILETEGFDVFTADSAEAGIEIFRSRPIDVTLTDIKMAGQDGLGLLDEIKTSDEAAVVIVITAFSSVETAIAALRKGAYDYITKPFVNEDLVKTVSNACQHRRLYTENRLLRREIRDRSAADELIGSSDILRSAVELGMKVAPTDAPVLITGESGTGKELIARAIHRGSPRSGGPFLAINCGALPDSLLESELFGHVRGSFTGAVRDSVGLLRSASGGTVFLDEIGEMPASLQVKLLRTLQERTVTPVGSAASYDLDARILAATNRRPEEAVSTGHLREDLYYRLNVVEIEMPPLRDRTEDIPELVRHFSLKAAESQGKPVPAFTPEAMEALRGYAWPGNVRELENAITRSVLLADLSVTLAELPSRISGLVSGNEHGDRSLYSLERRHILSVLKETSGDKADAAEILGIDLSTLYRKLKRYEGSEGIS